MKHIRILGLLMVIVFLATTTIPAKADAPEFISEPEYGVWDFDCGTYTVRYEFQGIDTFTIHWDQEFVNVHHYLQDAFYRTDGVGEKFTHVEQNSFKWTADGERSHGILWHMVIPGHGSVLIVAGNILFDWETGEVISYYGNPNKNNVVPDSVCDAFAQ